VSHPAEPKINHLRIVLLIRRCLCYLDTVEVRDSSSLGPTTCNNVCAFRAMKSDLKLFSPTHVVILVLVPLIAAALARWCRGGQHAARVIPYSLATLLAAIELAWYVYVVRVQGFHFPDGLPLELCDVTLWLTVYAAYSLRPWAFEIVYFTGLAGSGMALITPDLWAPFWTYPILSFFFAHGLTVTTILTLLWGKLAAPNRGSLWRVVIAVNAYAAVIGVFDAIFKTNYMYLRQKPQGASILNYFGPWPVYLIGGELLALALFWLLWLPYRRADRGQPRLSAFPPHR